MANLTSYLRGQWVAGSGEGVPMHDPTTGEHLGSVSVQGLDLGAAVAWARETGLAALGELSFSQRADLLDAAAKAINEHREELIDLSLRNAGNTRKDAKFDIDGASGTLAYYARLGRDLGDRKLLDDGEPSRLSRSPRYVGRHFWATRQGVAVLINAFNFPAWGMAEKAAAAWLAGMPVITKPAESTALVAHRVVEVLAAVLPAGVLSAVVGPPGDLLDHLDSQDVVAFTGSSATGAKVRGHAGLVARGVRVNVEADSLNAAVLGPDVEPGSETWDLFVREVVTDMTQKVGQKCTAIRRVLVPAELTDDAVEALAGDLLAATVGSPGDKGVVVGPVTDARQARHVRDGIEALRSVASVAWQAESVSGDCYVPPTLLRVDSGDADVVHSREVFGPVATLIAYDGSAAEAARLVKLGQGSLVTSIYTNKSGFARDLVLAIGPWQGRIHIGSDKVAEHSPGPGVVLPQQTHGGPGRAGGGEELGGQRGLGLYMQRVALQGDVALLEKILG